MIGAVVLFSRKYPRKRGESVSASLSALGMTVINHTYENADKLKRAVSRADGKWRREERPHDNIDGNTVLVVRYDNPEIFNGEIQKALGKRYYLFFDEISLYGGLGFSSTKGKEAKNFVELYGYDTAGVAELFLGAQFGRRYCSYVAEPMFALLTPLWPVATRWCVVGYHKKFNKKDPKIPMGIYEFCRGASFLSTTLAGTCMIGDDKNEVVDVPEQDCKYGKIMFLQETSAPVRSYDLFPIMGTNFFLVVLRTDHNVEKDIIYIGRKNIRSREKLCRMVNRIISHS